MCVLWSMLVVNPLDLGSLSPLVVTGFLEHETDSLAHAPLTAN